MNRREVYLLALWACALGAGFWLSQCTVASEPDGYRVLTEDWALGPTRVWTDPDTGCEYLVSSSRREMTPRLSKDGRQMCRETAP